jgi:hypothetical protein
LVAGRSKAKRKPWVLLCVLISEWMREEVMRIESLLLSCVLIRDWLREEALLKEALVAIRVNL